MEYDKGSMVITKAPLIKLNDLSTESEINEQEGIKLMLIGFFQGPRNIYQHNKNGHGSDTVLPLILDVSMFLNLISGHSMTKKRIGLNLLLTLMTSIIKFQEKETESDLYLN